MKISKIEKDENKWSVYIVSFEPNWLERLFGVQPKKKGYRQTDATYVFGGGAVYVDQSGEELGRNSNIGQAIDRFRRKW